jgi:hypothetical protein
MGAAAIRMGNPTMITVTSRAVLGFSGLVLGGLLTACTGATTATSATSPTAPTSTSTTASHVREPVAATPSTPAPAKPARPAAAVLGPDSYGDLKLHMPYAAAKRLGFIREGNVPSGSGCTGYDLYVGGKVAGAVAVSPDRGVEAIAPDQATTPQGITLGSTAKQVKAAYPDFDLEVLQNSGHTYARVTGNAEAMYRINVTNGVVDKIALQLSDQKCYE